MKLSQVVVVAVVAVTHLPAPYPHLPKLCRKLQTAQMQIQTCRTLLPLHHPPLKSLPSPLTPSARIRQLPHPSSCNYHQTNPPESMTSTPTSTSTSPPPRQASPTTNSTNKLPSSSRTQRVHPQTPTRKHLLILMISNPERLPHLPSLSNPLLILVQLAMAMAMTSPPRSHARLHPCSSRTRAFPLLTRTWKLPLRRIILNRGPERRLRV